MMRISAILVIITALVVVVAVTVVGQALVRPDQPLITSAGFTLDTITPNADGDSDITIFSYSLSRNARISLTFTGDDGRAYAFRADQLRGAGDYQVEFSGVVDGFTLPDEEITGEIVRRLIPDGRYQWRLQAVDNATGAMDERSGTLVIEGGSLPLPEITSLSVSPDVFSPNQDGIRDRTNISVYLSQPSDLSVYLEGANSQTIFLAERLEGRRPGEPGRHEFDYDGGVDLGADPPPDGVYTVVAAAQDAVGQRVERTLSLTIENGGDPQAEIAPQPIGVDVVFAHMPYDARYFPMNGQPGDLIQPPDDPQDRSFMAVNVPLGDLLVFKLTVENYGDVPIRTSGPPPGTVYEQNQVAATLGWFDESGAWRVGLDCDTATRDYPWRWAVGSVDDLVTVTDEESGMTYYYLPAGAQSVVWGAVRMTELIEARNPQKCWAGLIHEDVEVSLRNSRVGARDIELIDRSEMNTAP